MGARPVPRTEPFDGGSSILIGLILATVALLLGYETKSLLIGEGLEETKISEIRRLVNDEPMVDQVLNLIAVYLGPDEVLLTLELRFAKDARSRDLSELVRRIEKDVRERYPEISRVFYEAASLAHGKSAVSGFTE